MNLQKMFEMQAELDRRIIKEKGLEGRDLLPNTIVGFGFTLEQIEEAYMNKNAVNHKRQQEGY
ncbi:dUTP diphosphatase [Bacillus safensis]|uniref:dUTP diphosphatase n=1 Tax=Bacillus safensis TaxID=561879 RepID=UPI00090B589C|nr:dUTP diphosphatase [Bacillus safensis]APJ12031.1 hypothetical protein BSL056_14125 [Bacillus safensis]